MVAPTPKEQRRAAQEEREASAQYYRSININQHLIDDSRVIRRAAAFESRLSEIKPEPTPIKRDAREERIRRRRVRRQFANYAYPAMCNCPLCREARHLDNLNLIRNINNINNMRDRVKISRGYILSGRLKMEQNGKSIPIYDIVMRNVFNFRPMDIVLNPIMLPPRMTVGQLMELRDFEDGSFEIKCPKLQYVDIKRENSIKKKKNEVIMPRRVREPRQRLKVVKQVMPPRRVNNFRRLC